MKSKKEIKARIKSLENNILILDSYKDRFDNVGINRAINSCEHDIRELKWVLR